MRTLLLLLALVTVGCHQNTATYLETVKSAKYKVGDTIVVDEDFYKGCHLKVESIAYQSGARMFVPDKPYLMYRGTSPDCPIGGVIDSHVK